MHSIEKSTSEFSSPGPLKLIDLPRKIVAKENDSVLLQCYTNTGIHERVNWFFYDDQISVGKVDELIS